MIPFFFAIQHFLIVLAFFNKFGRAIFVFLSLSIFTYIYIVKPDAYDIFVYVDSVSYPFIFEPVFGFLLWSLSLVFEENRVVIFFVQAILALLFVFLCLKVNKNNFWMALALVLFSVSFTLSVNNILRQGFSSVLLILFVFSLIERKGWLATFLFFLAAGFHLSSIAFGAVSLVIFLSYIFFRGRRALFRPVSPGFVLVLILIIAGASFSFLGILLNLGFYSVYDGMVFSQNRVPLYLKVAPIFLIFAISEFFLVRKAVSERLELIRVLRAFFIIFTCFLALDWRFDEIGSRILFFYFYLELAFQLLCLNERRFKPMLISSLGAAFALNAWNVLGG
ncbi:EpsG family protein [uncultured Marinobacter sp.]|uniref:EpsG family protein n=1 Tax=uncultured Marinobacter sp. TaxID=187379 RepID=UPI0030C8CEA2